MCDSGVFECFGVIFNWKGFIYCMEMWDLYIFIIIFDFIFENFWS